MHERLGLVMDVLDGRYSVAEAAARRGVARKTAYKYLDRYLEEGPAGLVERSRRPLSSPQRTEAQIRDLVIQEKRNKPNWGPKKIVNQLKKRHPTLLMPSASTASRLLDAEGLVERGRRKSKSLAPAAWEKERTQADSANRVWTIDFKGEFRLGNGQLCYPLTLVDLYSRDPRVIHALSSTRMEPVREVMTSVFERDGLPDVIRSDCGGPFASSAIARISRLSIWWTKLGIRLERNTPGHPEQNAAHERMHRTLKAETTRPPQFDLTDQQKAFDVFRAHFSAERPHEGIGMRCPAELYTPSGRAFPNVLPAVTYPGHYHLRTVQKQGYIKWKGERRFISEVLVGEHVALEEVDDGLWSVYFGPILLGRMSAERTEYRPGLLS